MTVPASGEAPATTGETPPAVPGASGAAPVVVPGAAPAPPAGDGGWMASLDPETAKSPAVAKFKGKDWNEVGPKILQSYVNLEKWQIPGEGAGPEEIKKFRDRLGVPESADKYTVKPNVPEGVPWNDGTEMKFREMAHEVGLTNAQYQKLIDRYLGLSQQGIDGQATQSAEQLAQSHQALKQRWGGNYERNVGLVQRTVSSSGVEGLSDLLDTVVVGNVKLGNHPVMLELLTEMGTIKLDHGYIPGDNLVQGSASTQAELDAILNDKTHAYWKGDKAAVAKVTAMYQALNPKRP